jgi:hypothetical protein
MLDESELRAIDAWRFKYRLPSRAAAIRELIRRGLLTTDDPKRLAESGGNQHTARSTDFGVLDASDAPLSDAPLRRPEPKS